MVALTQKGTDPAAFAALASKAWQTTGKPLILRGSDPKALATAAAAVKGSRSLICCPAPEAAPELVAAAKENGHALAITAPDLDAMAALADSIKQGGFNDLVLQTSSIARRAALQASFKATGYPTLRFIAADDTLEGVAEAVTEINKYGSICVLPAFDAALISSLMTLRLNIYTDPQKPIQVEPKVYPIGEPKPDSPVFVTTNFSLTYFIVSGEIENSGISAWLLVPECEGLSVLTAWAAGKFCGATIGKFAKEIDLDKQVTGRQIIIPGYVAQISGELEESMPGWKVLVGPQEAADLESFIKARLAG
jgi:acetyl-CoA decarbonylase/synthase complex subunit gamma